MQKVYHLLVHSKIYTVGIVIIIVLKQEREKEKEQNILEEKKRELERLNNYGITDHQKQRIIDILETVEKSKVKECILQFLNRESFKTTLTV